MRHFFVSKLLPIAALCALLLTNACDNNVEVPPIPTTENLVGTWNSFYFEHEGLEVTPLYKMTLKFRNDGFCEQKLTKPGQGPLVAVRPYSVDYSTGILSPRLIIGETVHDIELFDLGYELTLVYLSGGQPDGFIVPWRARFHPF